MHTTISLYETDTFSNQFFKNYSIFKHGSKKASRDFGKDVSAVCNFKENSKLVFYPAPYGNVVTASNAFKDYLLAGCSLQFYEKNITVRQDRIERFYSYSCDYGKMSAEERKAAISSDIFYINKDFIKDDEILVFIDDIRITGAHEGRIKEVLVRENIKNDVIFIYIANYTGDNPQVEFDLNHYSVKTLSDISNIIRNDEFIFNTRVIKFILNGSEEDFKTFISYQSESFNNTLYTYSILNKYHLNDIYKENFEYLNNHIKNID